MPRRVLSGFVVSDKEDKTIHVRVERYIAHPVYKKRVRRHKKYAVHDPLNHFKVGDFVSIVESKPISKTKKWMVFNGSGSTSCDSKKDCGVSK